MDIIRYEPFFGKYMFSYQGDLYVVDGPIETEDSDMLVVTQNNHPYNGLSVPAKVQIQVTNHCNASCPHCYVSSGMSSVILELSDIEIRTFLEECQQIGVLQIEWSGGDPFVRKDFIAFLQYAHSLGFEQSLLTNGIAFGHKPSIIKDVWRYVYGVQVSMNGYGDNFDLWVGKRVWQSVLNGIANLISEKPAYGQVSVATVLDPKNVIDLESIGSLLSDLGVNTWAMARQIHNGRSLISEEEADEVLWISYILLQKMRERGIALPLQVLHPFDKEELDETDILPVEWITEPAARTFLYVSANGTVYPFPYYDGRVEWVAGSIRKSRLFDLWHSEPFTRMRAVTREKTGCGHCKKICQLWSRWFNYGRRMDIYESPINHPTCTNRDFDIEGGDSCERKTSLACRKGR